MKILVCSNFYPPNFIGGAELIAHFHLKEMQKIGHEVLVFSGKIDDAKEQYLLENDVFENVPIVKIIAHSRDYNIDTDPLHKPKMIERFARILDSFQPDIIHYHNLKGLSIGMIQEGKNRNIYSVITFHDNWGFCYKNILIKNDLSICKDHNDCFNCSTYFFYNKLPIRIYKDYLMYNLNLIDNWITPSKYIANNYKPFYESEKEINVVWNGINIDRFKKIHNKKRDKDKIRFTFIGFLGAHKGILVLLDAVNRIKKKKFIINIIGDGHDKSVYEDYIGTNKLKEKVFLLGKIENKEIDNIFESTDILILPSIWPENQPVTITEAMASKIPVIASNIGGIPELVEDNKEGVLFAVGNSKELADKMEWFIHHPEKIEEYGTAAYNKIKYFSFSNQVNKILEVYNKKLISKKQQSYIVLVYSTNTLSTSISKWINSTMNNSKWNFIKFIYSDWIDQSLYQNTMVLLVTHFSTRENDILYAIKKGIPIVVPIDNFELMELCINKNIGLYYSNIVELEVCLEFLLFKKEVYYFFSDNCLNYSSECSFSE